MRILALAVVLCVGTAAAQTSADAPVVVQAERAQLLKPNGEWVYLHEGTVCLNKPAAENTAKYVRDLEADHISDGQIAAVVVGGLVLGFLGGYAAARLLPAK